MNTIYNENLRSQARQLRKRFDIEPYGVDWRRSFRLASDILHGRLTEKVACAKMKQLVNKNKEKQRKKQERNEIIHQQMGVDGWQEIYADAPCEEDIRKEMAERDEEEKQNREPL